MLANLFMHYAFDRWITTGYKKNPWARYADDGIIHCKDEKESRELLGHLEKRMIECGLEIHPDKTKIIYCKDSKRKGQYTNTSFDFLGYTYSARMLSCKNGSMFVGFNPAVSKNACKSIRMAIRSWKLHRRTSADINKIAHSINPILRGWINYYGKFHKSELFDALQHVNRAIIQWVKRKYKRFWRRTTRACEWLKQVSKYKSKMFSHWEVGIIPTAG